MDKQLRLIVGQIVVESKLSKQAKLQMINFVQKEATDTQVKVLLMDGNIVHLDEQTEEIANARFDLFVERKDFKDLLEFIDPFNAMYQLGTKDGFIAAAFVGVVASAAEKAYKRFFSKAARFCKGRSGTEKTGCMNKFKNDGIKEQIKVYQKGLKMCNKSKTQGN
jgi:hypothetical protein